MIATKFLRIYLCFRCRVTQTDWSKHCRLARWVRNQRWRPVNGSGYEITYISACMRDSNNIAFPVPRRYLLFLTHPDKRQYLDQSSRVAWHRKHRYSRWNCVAIMCTSWDIRYFISTSGSRLLSLISHSPWRPPVLSFAPLCCSMQKICGFRWNFTYIPSAMSDFVSKLDLRHLIQWSPSLFHFHQQIIHITFTSG